MANANEATGNEKTTYSTGKKDAVKALIAWISDDCTSQQEPRPKPAISRENASVDMPR